MSKAFPGILKDLKAGKFKPLYVLHGDEAFFIDEITNYIADHALTEGEKGFNQSIVYGLDTNASQMIGLLKRYPAMAAYQVVILKEAHRMKDIKSLLSYFENPVPTTIFVVAFKNTTTIFKRGSKMEKAISKQGLLMESKKLYENQVPAWVDSYMQAKGFTIRPAASQLITEFIGNDLAKVSNELDKLLINLEPGVEVDSKLVEKNIGISRDYNVFELQNALGKKDRKKVFRIVKHFGNNPKDNPILKTIPSLYSFFSKLYCMQSIPDRSQGNLAKILKVNPFFTRDYNDASKRYSSQEIERVLELLYEYDLRAKGIDNVNNKEVVLQKEMMLKILG